MNKALRAVAGGLAGMAAMSVVLIIGEAEARYQLGVPGAIARFVGVPNRLLLGSLLFLGAGVIAWPLLFLVVEQYVRPLPGGGDPAVRGVALALVLWVAFVILGSGGQRGMVLVLYLGFTFIAHVAYGFVLGAVYDRLGREEGEREGVPA